MPRRRRHSPPDPSSPPSVRSPTLRKLRLFMDALESETAASPKMENLKKAVEDLENDYPGEKEKEKGDFIESETAASSKMENLKKALEDFENDILGEKEKEKGVRDEEALQAQQELDRARTGLDSIAEWLTRKKYIRVETTEDLSAIRILRDRFGFGGQVKIVRGQPGWVDVLRHAPSGGCRFTLFKYPRTFQFL